MDLDSTNVWNVDQNEIPKLWEEEKDNPIFPQAEDKLLNTMRIAFEVIHFNPEDKREADKYQNGEWAVFSHTKASKGHVAIRKKTITRLTELTYENIRHMTASGVLELIDRNFGGGWEAVPLHIKDIIASAFDVSNTQLPTSRLHKEGGTLEKKVAQGYEVLEIEKGTWTEAIFCKKKDPAVKLRMINEDDYDEDGNKIRRHTNGKNKRKSSDSLDDDDDDILADVEELDDEDLTDEELAMMDRDDDSDDDYELDDDNLTKEDLDGTYYSQYTEEADGLDEEENLDGFSIEG